MKFGWEVLGPIGFGIEIGIISLLYAIALVFIIFVVKRKFGYFAWTLSLAISVASSIFALSVAEIANAIISTTIFTIILFANIGELRNFVAMPFKKVTAKNGKFGVEKIFDRSALYRQIDTAVQNLSKTRTGALITFEKETSLKDFMNNGVAIHAPASAELLSTIFYPGTRLHDGAVIIHGNEIVAASVFYTPTTKAFAGKYGSRHRAALGISEVSDAITVVVSEETGRISFAVNGELQTVDASNFLKVFENYMSESDKDE